MYESKYRIYIFCILINVIIFTPVIAIHPSLTDVKSANVFITGNAIIIAK